MSSTAATPGKTAFTDLLSIADLDRATIDEIFATAAAVKARPQDYRQALVGRSLVLLFEKPSLRTRVTFEMGMVQMGGHSVFLDHQRVRLGERESIKDVACNLERWADAMVARTFLNRTVTELAAHASKPVINGLSNLLHPCQGLTDLFTLREHFGGLEGRKLCWVGDGNNTCHSLIHGAARLGLDLTVVTPEGYEPNSRVLSGALKIAEETGAAIHIENDLDAVTGAHVISTDTWTSMGQEVETEERTQVFSPYQVNAELMAKAAPDCVFLHCLPAHRGAEVSAEVIDSDQSLVYQTAENRLHVQKAILLLLIGRNA